MSNSSPYQDLDSALPEMNWQDFLDPTPNSINSTNDQLPQALPPSPPHTIGALSPYDEQPNLSLVEYFRKATDEVYAPFSQQSEPESSLSPEILAVSNYPLSPLSPSSTVSICSNVPRDGKDDKTESIEVKTPPIIRHRGPGRPSKAQLAAEGDKRLSGRSLITMRRQIHNGSAMRSRARFNSILEELWDEVPEVYRTEVGSDNSRLLSRAEKIEYVISYVRDLKNKRRK